MVVWMSPAVEVQNGLWWVLDDGWTDIRRRREKRMVSVAWYLDLREKREMVVGVGRRWGGWWGKTREKVQEKKKVYGGKCWGGRRDEERRMGSEFCTRREKRGRWGVRSIYNNAHILRLESPNCPWCLKKCVHLSFLICYFA